MGRFGFAIACCVLLAGTSAQAQLVDGSGTAASSVTAGSPGVVVSAPAGDGVVTFNGSGGSFESTVVVNTDSITFDSGNASVGPFATTTSSTNVNVTVTNNTGQALSVTSVHSEIIPAGLGFYLQDTALPPADNNSYLGYPQSLSGLSFADVTTNVAAGDLFASADFKFQITSGDTTLYSLTGSLALSFDGQGQLVVTNNLSDAEAALDGFVTAWDTPSGLAYAWDTTPVDLDLGWSLGAGQSQTLNYSTTVSSFTRAGCITPATKLTAATDCLVAFSGFGDPVGRGGGTTFAALSTFALAADPEFIQKIVFDPVTVPFSFTFGAVPEPATWMTMVLGFGLLGAALRRRRVATVA
jgi:hypothetical protein